VRYGGLFRKGSMPVLQYKYPALGPWHWITRKDVRENEESRKRSSLQLTGITTLEAFGGVQLQLAVRKEKVT